MKDISFYKKEFEVRNCTLLSKSIAKNIDKLKFKCNIHTQDEQQITWGNFYKTKTLCKYCRKEIPSSRKSDVNMVIQAFKDHDFIPLFKVGEYKNKDQKLPCICIHHVDKGVQYKSYALILRRNCQWCSLTKVSGENHYAWKGGSSPLNSMLKRKITTWKSKSAKNSNYCCVLTNVPSKGKFDIHHLYAMELIVEEIFNITNISKRGSISEYTNQEVEILISTCLELHEKYGLGVLLHPKLHKLFHAMYGYGGNTHAQFDDFKYQLKLGKFDYYLIEYGLPLAINL